MCASATYSIDDSSAAIAPLTPKNGRILCKRDANLLIVSWPINHITVSCILCFDFCLILEYWKICPNRQKFLPNLGDNFRYCASIGTIHFCRSFPVNNISLSLNFTEKIVFSQKSRGYTVFHSVNYHRLRFTHVMLELFP